MVVLFCFCTGSTDFCAHPSMALGVSIDRANSSSTCQNCMFVTIWTAKTNSQNTPFFSMEKLSYMVSVLSPSVQELDGGGRRSAVPSGLFQSCPVPLWPKTVPPAVPGSPPRNETTSPSTLCEGPQPRRPPPSPAKHVSCQGNHPN